MGIAPLVKCHSEERKVAGSVPGQDRCLGCAFGLHREEMLKIFIQVIAL